MKKNPRRSEEHTSELQSRVDLVCRLLLEKKIEKLESYEVEDILELNKEDWIQKFGVDEGILYFNRISKLNVNNTFD